MSETKDPEKIRQQALAQMTEQNNRNLPEMQIFIDNLIEVINANRGHIGGMTLVMVPLANDVLMSKDPQIPGEAPMWCPDTSVVSSCCMNGAHRPLLCHEVKNALRRLEAPDRPPVLAHLVACRPEEG